MYRILLVEDDETIGKTITNYLNGWGYEVGSIESFDKVLEEFLKFDPHLVLLDITLPFYNGFHWCTQIRKVSKVPIVFLSSAGDNMNIVTAMNMGGDDFIAKPFDLHVLVAKIQAVLRRTYSFAGQVDVIEAAGAILHTKELCLTYKNEKVSLSKNEWKILKTLMERAGQVVSRETLMEELWDSDAYIDDNTLTVNMNRLRRRLERIGLKNYIATKKGLGYMVRSE